MRCEAFPASVSRTGRSKSYSPPYSPPAGETVGSPKPPRGASRSGAEGHTPSYGLITPAVKDCCWIGYSPLGLARPSKHGYLLRRGCRLSSPHRPRDQGTSGKTRTALTGALPRSSKSAAVQDPPATEVKPCVGVRRLGKHPRSEAERAAGGQQGGDVPGGYGPLGRRQAAMVQVPEVT